MSEHLPVRVAAIFEPGRKPKPVWFELHGEQHKVIEICYFWESSLGKATVYNYSVNTKTGVFEIAFNTLDQSWQVVNKLDE